LPPAPSSPLISVLMPVFNAAGTLPTALDSLLAQTWTDFEIVAVDDGSNDDAIHGRNTPCTREILRHYGLRDARVRPIFTDHQGIVAALNRGLLEARGRLIARMDADDVCSRRRLELQSDYLARHPDVGLVACLAKFGGNARQAGGYKLHLDWTNSLLEREEIALGRFQESPLVHPTVMFRRNLVQALGGYRDGPFPEDYELWLRWLDAGVIMAKLPRFLYTWNDPPHRLSRTHPRYSVQAFYGTKARYLARWLARHNPWHPRVMVVGAGRITRRRAEMLLPHGVSITAWVDIDPRKIGRDVAGRPVIHRDCVPDPGQCFVLSYVSGHGAPEDVRAYFLSRGYTPGKDFMLAA